MHHHYEIVVSEQRAHISDNSTERDAISSAVTVHKIFLRYTIHATIYVQIQHSWCNAPSGGRFVGPFSSALDTLSCLVLHSFGISVGVLVASCCRVFFFFSKGGGVGRHILIGASCFTYICCRLYTVVSDRVCSSTDRIRKLCYIRSYSIEINSVKTII